jgi:hypothetical protein
MSQMDGNQVRASASTHCLRGEGIGRHLVPAERGHQPRQRCSSRAQGVDDRRAGGQARGLGLDVLIAMAARHLLDQVGGDADILAAATTAPARLCPSSGESQTAEQLDLARPGQLSPVMRFTWSGAKDGCGAPAGDAPAGEAVGDPAAGAELGEQGDGAIDRRRCELG